MFTPTATAQENYRLIEAEFTNRRGFYYLKLKEAGVPPHELDDAFGTLFDTGLRYAGSYDAEISHLSTYLGRWCVRSVATGIYASRRPGWRRAAELESPINERRENETENESSLLAEGFTESDCEQNLAVTRFLESLYDVLDDKELYVLQRAGLSVLQDRMSSEDLAHYCEILEISRHMMRKLLSSLKTKLSAHAAEHFDEELLAGRECYEAA